MIIVIPPPSPSWNCDNDYKMLRKFSVNVKLEGRFFWGVLSLDHIKQSPDLIPSLLALWSQGLLFLILKKLHGARNQVRLATYKAKALTWGVILNPCTISQTSDGDTLWQEWRKRGSERKWDFYRALEILRKCGGRMLKLPPTCSILISHKRAKNPCLVPTHLGLLMISDALSGDLEFTLKAIKENTSKVCHLCFHIF